jgi:hypothetical protein
VIAWDPIYPAAAISPWQSESKPVPTVGYNANWVNPHPASVFPVGSHPWEFIAPMDFAANWINAWSNTTSQGPAGQSWTKYSTTVTGEGDFVLQFLADNASWIYIDGELIGFQDQDWQHNSTGRYTIQLSGAGPHELSFIIWDGGGAAGGKFRLETVQSFQENNPGEDLPPPPSDTIAPVISGPGNITTEATGPSGAVVTFTATAVDDKDGSVPVLAVPASGSTFALGTMIVDLGAADAAGNQAFATFNVTVEDTTPPVLVTRPRDLVLEAAGLNGTTSMQWEASAVDAVAGAVPVNYDHSWYPAETYPIGTTTVNYYAQDGYANRSTGSFTITVRDTIAPVLTVPANLTLEATSAAGAVATFAATATDAVGVASLTSSAASGSTFALGTNTVTVIAKDAAGNTATGSFTITVQDTTKPVITSVTPSIASIWPPNKKMVPVTISVVATDAVSTPTAKILSVTTNQPDRYTQWQITPGSLTVNLLADRNGDESLAYKIFVNWIPTSRPCG